VEKEGEWEREEKDKDKERETGDTRRYLARKRRINSKVKERHREHTKLAIWNCSPGSKSHPRRDTDSHLRGTGAARVLEDQVFGQEQEGCRHIMPA
jgi:hypothetical protein